ncbi:MAG: pre-peptidase C-terminal domain-containing protein [Sphingomonadales bacterium]|nr:pre-peptidase C-terminal domain-containing protein [Sphingomonadales bacterium]
MVITRHFGKGKASRKAFGKAARKGTGKAAGTAATPAARLDFEMIEARVLLSADINPALGAAALDLSGADTAQIIAAKLEAAAAEPVLEIAETASPQGAGVDLSALDLTFLDRGLLAVPGTQVDVATFSADLDETTTEAITTEELEGGQSVALNLRSTGDLSVSVELRDPEGTVIASLAAGETLGAPVQLTATGTYTLSLQRLAGAGTADVALLLNAVLEAEQPGTAQNDDFASAESLTPSALAFGTDARQLAAFGDVQIDSDDVWSFEVAEGDVLTLISALNLSDAPQLALYAADGRQLAVGDSARGPYALIDGLTLRAEDAGTVYVVIQGEGSYALTGLVNASYMNPVIADMPRDLGQTGIGQGEISYGLVDDPDTGEDDYRYLEELENGDVVEGAIWIDGPLTGNTLTIEGEGFLGNNAAEGLADRDFITLDMPEGGELFLEVSGQIEGVIPRISVFDSTGFLITSASAAEGYASVSVSTDFPETFYVAISADEDADFDAFEHNGAETFATGSYSIYFSLTGGASELPPPPDLTLSDLTTVESDDTLATATALDLPLFATGSTTVSGMIGDANGTADRDIYSVFLRVGDTITGTVTAARLESGLDPILTVFDGAGQQLAFNDDFYGLDSRLTFTASATGYYYFGIASYSNFDYNPTQPAEGNGSGGSTGTYEILFEVTRNLSMANASLYQVQAEVGDTLELRTTTPGDAAGRPDNLLDPALALYGPDGTLLASNLNGAEDGRNATLSYTVTEAGTYLIEVVAEAGQGLYRVEVEGASGSYSRAPQLVGSSIDDVGVLAEAPEFIDVTFDVPLYGGNLDAGLLSIDGVGANGVTLIAADTLRFDVTGLITSDGAHAVVLAGGVTSLPGAAADSASWTLMTDFIAPAIASSSPAAGGRVAPGQQEIEVTFTEALDLGLASLADFALYDVINDSYLEIERFEVVDMTTLRVRFAAPLDEGLYRFEIDTTSAAMVDAVGNPLADGMVTFGVDAGALAAAFSASSPLVLGAYVADLAGALDQGDDVDSHAFTLGSGQRLLLSAATPAGVRAQISLETADGTVIWQATTDGSGAPVRMAASQAMAAGDYRVVITGQGDIGA